ncbi:glycosyltransferase family 39 protein [Deinococcus sp.]|uniref:alginate O-acetyltransferase AlgX-related protein n=1 Tax=Deinococcus sp. TaxID=47478 RepID=UPI0025C100D0|nr:glycosyltransferase family 39 protein [Deinococcus sp.]
MTPLPQDESPAASRPSDLQAADLPPVNFQAQALPGATAMTPRLWLALLGVMGLTFLLRAFHVGPSWDIHVDELTYLNISRYVEQRLQVRLYGEPFYLHPPAYFFLEAAWLKLFHPTGDLIQQVYAARYLNVLLGTLTSGLLFLLGRRIAGWQAGLIAALLFALDPFMVRSNSQTLLETSAMFWTLLGWTVLFGAAGRGVFRWRDVLLTGVAFGLALLTKEMLVFLTLLPLGLLFLVNWSVPRRVAAALVSVSLLSYLPYPLIVFLVGDWRLFMEAKFSGVSRFLGATKVTGFKRAGGPSLADAVVANLQTFATTYLLVLTGLVALAILLRRGDRLMRMLAALLGSAYLMLGFSVVIGTLEEQFFYYLVVPSMLATGVALWLLMEQPSRLRRSYVSTGRVVGGLFVLWTLFVWNHFHGSPSNSYEQLRNYLGRTVPAGRRISTLTEESMFLLGGYNTAVWNDVTALRGGQAQYAVLSTQQVAKGYGYATPQFKAWLDQNARLVAAFPSRTYGQLNLYQLPAFVASGRLGNPVTIGKDGWLFLPSEYQADASVAANPRQVGHDAAVTIERLSRLLRSRGQTLEVALVPTKARVYSSYLPSGTDVSAAVQGRYGRTIRSLQDGGVLAPDLAAAFAREAAKPDAALLYFKQDHHWTPQGAQLTAQALEKTLRGRVDLSGLPLFEGQVQVLAPTTAPLHSLTNLLSPSQRAEFKPEMYRPLRVQTKAAADTGLLDEVTPSVTLVGSSFSAYSSLEFGPLLSTALARTVLNVAAPNGGPFKSMTKYLASDAFHQTPPKLIVWELREDFLNNEGAGHISIDFLLNAGANVLNKCSESRVHLPAPSWNAADGTYRYAVNKGVNPLGDYLHFSWKAPGQNRVRVALVTATGETHDQWLDLPDDGRPRNLNVPIYTLASKAVTQIRVYGKPGAPAPQLQDSRLCQLPDYLIDASSLFPGATDLLSDRAPSRLSVEGLGQIETTGHRWGVGPETSFSFFSPDSRVVTMHVKFRSPIDAQAVGVFMNGQRLVNRTGLYRDDVSDLLLKLQVRPGLNTLSFKPRLLNIGATRFAPDDARAISVEFTKFELINE